MMNEYYVQYDLFNVEGLPPKVCKGSFYAKSQYDLLCELKDKNDPHKIIIRVVKTLNSNDISNESRKASISSKIIIFFMGFLGFAMTMGATIGQIFFHN